MTLLFKGPVFDPTANETGGSGSGSAIPADAVYVNGCSGCNWQTKYNHNLIDVYHLYCIDLAIYRLDRLNGVPYIIGHHDICLHCLERAGNRITTAYCYGCREPLAINYRGGGYFMPARDGGRHGMYCCRSCYDKSKKQKQVV